MKGAGIGSRTKAARSLWVPERQGTVWIDCNAQVGRDMRDLHPFLDLSPRAFNEKTALVIGFPNSAFSAVQANAWLLSEELRA